VPVSEFPPDPISNVLSSVRLLTNVSGGPAFLNLYNVEDGSVLVNGTPVVRSKPYNKHFIPNESVFFYDYLVDDKTSTMYNKDKLDSYISQNILSDAYFTPYPPSIKLYGITNSTHSLALTTSSNFTKLVASNTFNHLSLSYALDYTLANIKLVAYRDTDGMSYSEDGGVSCIKIPNTGLLYPNEITSYAIQAYTTCQLSAAKSKIFIGTLREGLKSFTVGMSTSWDQEGSDEMTITGHTSVLPGAVNNFCNFKYSILNTDLVLAPDGTLYDYIGIEFAPCYVLAVNNYPISAGNGILVFVNTESSSSESPAPYIYMFKYLHSTTKQYVTSARGYVETPEILTDFVNWTCICDPLTRLPIANSPVSVSDTFPIIYDQLKQIPYNSSNEYNTTTSGDLIAVTQSSANVFTTDLYSLIGYTNIADVQDRHLTFTKLTDTCSVHPVDFSGLSCYDTFIFVTESDAVWYWNTAVETPEWLKLIDSPTHFGLSQALQLTPVDSSTYIVGLTGFGLLQTRNVQGLTGILSSDFGYIQCTILNTSGVLSVTTSSISLKSNICSNKVQDSVVLSDLNLVFSCGLELEPLSGYLTPGVYGPPSKYLVHLPRTASNIPSGLASSTITTLIYKNYTSTESPQALFYNVNNISTLPSAHNTDQLFDIQFIYTEAVQAKKTLDSTPVYYSGYSFGFVNEVINTYVNMTSKYHALSLMFRSKEQVTLNNVTSLLESEIIIPVVPEISYRSLYPVCGYSYPSIAITSSGTGSYT